MTTIATFNLLHGLNPSTGQIDLRAVARAIEGMGADVVALQEVDREQERSCGADQLGWLAAELGWHGLFAPTLLGDPDRAWAPLTDGDPGGPAYGIGLLSRGRIVEARQRRLPGGGAGQRSHRTSQDSWPGWDREPRGTLTCSVETVDGPLQVTVAHLSYMPWRAIAQLRVASRQAAGSPSVLLGDLNLPGPAVRVATPGWEHHQTPPTFPAWRPRVRLDHILTRGLVVSDIRVVSVAASDHRPVAARLRPAG